MPIRPESHSSESTLQLLKRCYRFVSQEWQRAKREPLPDEGFERRLRESCSQHLQEWTISEEHEMRLGVGLETASGTLHEIDIVARRADTTAILEAKNRKGTLPDKNDVIILFAKVLDYLAENPVLASRDMCLALVSSGSFDTSGLAACLGLGIHPVGVDIRPLPILVNTATIMDTEIRGGLRAPSEIQDRLEDMCAQLNSVSSTLRGTWLDSRCGYVSDDTIVLRPVGPLPTFALAQQIRQLNSDCTDILRQLRAIEHPS